jgi:poly(A) polymerase/tRNA nucleotidyltransferase (CCA-adding enzyme)
MARLGILAAIIPEGFDPAPFDRLLEAGAPTDPLLRLAALLDGDAMAFAERLRLSGEERDRLIALRAPPPDPDADPRQLLADVPPDILIGRCWLAGPGCAALRKRLAETPVPIFPLEGRDVLALGIAPGPRVGALLRQVRAWWLAGGCVADAAACRSHLTHLVDPPVC